MNITRRPAVTMIPIDTIDPGERPWHSCRYFLDGDVARLAGSIARAGTIEQPIGVRRKPGTEMFEVVFGRRRLLAAIRNGMALIPGQTYGEITDDEAALLSLHENLPRRNPSLLERGWSFARLEDHGMSQTEIAIEVGLGTRGTSTVCEGIGFARAIPEGLLLDIAAQIAPASDPRLIVARTARLSKRTLALVSRGMAAGNDVSLRRAIAAIHDGKKKREVTRAVRADQGAEGPGSARATGPSSNAAQSPRSMPDLLPHEFDPAVASDLLRRLIRHIEALEPGSPHYAGDGGLSPRSGERARRFRSWIREACGSVHRFLAEVKRWIIGSGVTDHTNEDAP